MNKQDYYIWWTIGGGLFAACLFYMELQVVQRVIVSGEVTYVLPKYSMVLKGTAAILAHIGTFGIGVLSAILAMDSYAKFLRSKKL